MKNTFKKKWNTLEIQTNDYYTTFEYSENFDNLFNTIAAKCLQLKRESSNKISVTQADKYYKKYSKLKFELDNGHIKLDTQLKADEILDELSQVMNELN